MSLPPALEDTLVLDLSTVGPATRAARILADYGAQVVKLGVPPSKASLQTTPPFYAYSGDRGMRHIKLDLKAPESREAFLKLVERADVVIESYRPGVAERLGIGYEQLRARNERIVYCSTSGYGQDGPASQWAGHDLNYVAVSGFLHCNGRLEDGRPPVPGASIADSAAGGMHAAMAILAALLRRTRSGVGEYLDVALADGMLHLMSIYIDEYLATGTRPGPGHYILTGRYACYSTYLAGDGKWLALGVIEPAFWANVCNGLGLERWIEHQHDEAVQDEIRADLTAAFARKSRDEWVAELAHQNTCLGPVYSIEELIDDPQFRHRGVIVDAEHPEHGRFRQLGATFAGQERPKGVQPVPDLSAGSDTFEVLAEAGLSTAVIEDLRDRGLVG
jgi:alpha-methylacyl-CoA racemase